MKAINSNTNTAVMIAANGVDFFEDTTKHTGVWRGFKPHSAGCKVAAVKIVNSEGVEAVTPTWVGTTLDLEEYISAGLVKGDLAYITEFTLTSGAAHMVKDTINNL
jgi:hypothetical protein